MIDLVAHDVDLFSRAEMRRAHVTVLDEAVGLLEQLGIRYRLPMPVSYRTYRWMLLHGGQVAWWIARVKNGVSESIHPSMVSDVELGRKTEVRQLNGEIVRLGLDHRLPMPIAAKLVRLVEAMEGESPTS